MAVMASGKVSKRSTRAYVEEASDHDEKPTYLGATRSEEPFTVAIERTISDSGSTRTSSEFSSATDQSDRTGDDLSTELTGLLGEEALSVTPRKALEAHIDTATHHPVNFGVVVPGVYRCSYPKIEDYSFIQDLKLKTIVTLVDKDFPQGYKPFIAANDIRHHVITMRGTKKENIPVKVMKSILRLVLDRQNHPLLIHCNHGKHRTGCVVAVVRKVSGWELSSIIDEYRSYAAPKIRECDIEYINTFQLSSLSNLFKETKAIGFRVPNFFRILLFTFIVLAIWMISESKLAHPPKRHKGDVPSSSTGSDS